MNDISKNHNSDDLSRLLFQNTKATVPFRKLVAIIEVGPHDQAKISLGVFNEEHPPFGFVTQCEPGGDHAHAVDRQIMSVPAGQSSLYELKLFVVNYRDRPVDITVWQLLRSP